MIRIGTRGSALAMAQTQWVCDQLQARGHQACIEVIKTKGDVVMDRFDKMEGKGFFTKEIEDALSDHRIDLAVHSLKDLPTDPRPDLCVRAIPKRESPFDVLIFRPDVKRNDGALPTLNARRIGTSSLRRVASLAQHYPGAEFVPIRGNLPTRLSKVQSGQLDAIVLAQAGLNRLDLDLGDLIALPLPPEIMVPAPGQGALAIETRRDFDTDLAFLHDDMTADCTQVERFILAHLEGGCQLPLGVWVVHNEDDLFQLHLFLAFPDQQQRPIRLTCSGPTTGSVQEQAIDALGRAAQAWRTS